MGHGYAFMYITEQQCDQLKLENDAAVTIQKVGRGIIARRRIHFAMLNPPDDGEMDVARALCMPSAAKKQRS